MNTAYLGIGSNMGERRATLRQARHQLASTPGISHLDVSSLYETEPVGGPAGQGDFLNAVIRLETSLEPLDLWQRCLQIEQAAGRTRTVKNGPRSLDLDILLYGDRCLDTGSLTIPHPRLHERRFVLVPLCDLEPQLRHPHSGKTMHELLQLLEDNGVKLISREW